jgi:valyl-tRNA synthetase
MAPVVAAIEGLRNIRGESNLSPAQKLVAHVQSADPELRASLERWKGYLMPLAGLSQVHVSGPGARPAQAAAYVGPGMEIYVPLAGLIDFAAERDRLTKEIARIDQDLAGILRKLDNPNFVAKAPPDVVEKDRARVEELKERRVKLQENLGRLAEPESPALAAERAAEDVDITVVEAPVVEAPSVPMPVVPVQVVQFPPVPPARAAAPAAPAAPDESVDLAEELKEEHAAAEVPPPAAAQQGHEVPQMKADAEEELTAADHHDLGMAYMGMGLVDQAVKELTIAQKGDPSPAVKKARRVAKKARGVARKAVAAVKRAAGKAGAAVKKKVAAKKAVARKAPSRGGRPVKKGAKAKVAVKKAATQVKAKAKAALVKGKAKAGATKAKVKAGASKVKARTAAKKAARPTKRR